jgi:hypothetical protein
MRGKALDGWVRVAGEGVEDEVALREWVERGLGFARTLPPKD